MQLFEHPPPDQSNIVNALGLGNPPDRLNLLGLQGHSNGLCATLEHRFGDLFELLLKVCQIVRIPEHGEFFNGVCFWESFCSFVFPSIVSLYLSTRHWSGRYGISVSIGKLNYHAEQMSPAFCLTQDVVDRVLSSGPCPQHQGFTKAHFLNVFRFYPMRSDVVDPIFWPDQLADLYVIIALQSAVADNKRSEVFSPILAGRSSPPMVGSGTHPPDSDAR
jgi:hypothetical protein